jgi:hypothetical protein
MELDRCKFHPKERVEKEKDNFSDETFNICHTTIHPWSDGFLEWNGLKFIFKMNKDNSSECWSRNKFQFITYLKMLFQ